MVVIDIPLSLFTAEELGILEALMARINDERLLDNRHEFKAAQVIDGLKLALTVARRDMHGSDQAEQMSAEEPGRSYFKHLVERGLIEPGKADQS